MDFTFVIVNVPPYAINKEYLVDGSTNFLSIIRRWRVTEGELE